MRQPVTPVHGILDYYKPVGITSMSAVNRIKRLTGQRRVGHGGTLDPIAEGVLPICFGQATRTMEYLIGTSKVYRMRVRFGVTTDTYDAEGQVVRERDASNVTPEALDTALEQFRGTFLQTPPMFSALKHEGKRLYDLARQGEEVEREPRRVHVERIDVAEFHDAEAVIDVECGRGVYMRSLAHDVGETLGCGAHVKALLRLRQGAFRVEEAVTMERLEEAVRDDTWRSLLRPLDAVVQQYRAFVVTPAQEKLIKNGHALELGPRGHGAGHLEPARAYNQAGVFVALLRFQRAEGVWQPVKVFHLDEPSPLAPVPEGTGQAS